MKINKIVKIGIEEVYNNNNLSINFREDNTPYLSFRKITSTEEIPLPIQMDKVIEIIKNHPFNNGVSLGSYTLIQNNADEIIDIVKYNSPEYKKYFSKTTIKPSSLEQGTVVTLDNGSNFVFLKQFYGIYFYRFVSLISDIKKFNVISQGNIESLKRNIINYKFFESEPSLYNLFYSIEDNKVIPYLANTKSTKIIEVKNCIEEIKNRDVRIMMKASDESFLNEVVNLEEFKFDPIRQELEYNRIKKHIIFINSKFEMNKFKNDILNYIEQL